MAGDWIKMTVALSTSPKVVRITSALNADKCPHRVRVVGALHALWCLFDQHSTDGKLAGYTAEMVDEVVGWPGFATSVAEVDWLIITPQGIEIPEFDTHNGAPAKRRAMESDRKRLVRKMSASNADKKRTREEKRRGKHPVVPHEYSRTFEAFWKAWPPGERKQSRPKCWEAWQTGGCEAKSEVIAAHVEAMKRSDGWRRGFVPAPLVYLNQSRWDGAEVAEPELRRVAV